MIKSAEEFVRLRASEDPSEYGRAAHEPAPLEVWIRVVRDYPEMRFWVAQNKTVPLEILEVLSVDADPDVRSMVARTGKTPPELLERLARDPEEAVRNATVNNRSLPRSILEAMLDDAWEVIRERAAERLRAKG